MAGEQAPAPDVVVHIELGPPPEGRTPIGVTTVDGGVFTTKEGLDAYMRSQGQELPQSPGENNLKPPVMIDGKIITDSKTLGEFLAGRRQRLEGNEG